MNERSGRGIGADAPRVGVREANRADFERRLIEAATRQLAEHGAAGLGMRALARELEVTPGALYRYVRSRDELLTLLVIDAYRGLERAVADATDASRRGGDGGARAAWRAVWRAVRGWALAHPNEYALVYGTPVPGYSAPVATLEPASAVTRALTGIVLARAAMLSDLRGRAEGDPRGARAARRDGATAPRALRDDVARIRAWLDAEGHGDRAGLVPDEALVATVRAWTELFGTVSFELFGHYRGSIESNGAYLDAAADRTFAEVERALA